MADTITNSTVSTSFIALDGDVIRSQQAMASITRPACDGQAYRYLGVKGEPFRLIGTRDTSTYVTAAALIETWRTIPGTMCQITIRGVAYDYMLCHRMTPVMRKQCANAVGGIEGGSYLVVVEWVFEDQSIS
jgi:hypothetical protein